MEQFFEKSDTLNMPIECFIYRAEEEDFPVRLHWHYYMELIYVLQGTAQMKCADSDFEVCRGDFILFHPQIVHAVFSEHPGTLEYAVLKFDIGKIATQSAYLPKLRSIFKNACEQGMPMHIADAEEKLKCRETFLECIREMQNRDYGYDVIIRGHILELLMRLLRLYRNYGFAIENVACLPDREYTIEGITEYIDVHIAENPKVQDLATRCGMSYSNFAKQFHDIYRRSCKEYMETIRLHKVENFLLFTDYDLSYISQECGYSDCSHLIHSFKHSRGLTPKQYRSRYRNNFGVNL